MIINAGAGVSKAEQVKYGNSNVGDTLDKLKCVTTNEYSTLSLEKALASMCDKHMTENNMSYNGRFASADGWFSYNVYHCATLWSGYITEVNGNESYSFYRNSGADAVLTKLNNSLEEVSNSLNDKVYPNYTNGNTVMTKANGVTSYTLTEDAFVHFYANFSASCNMALVINGAEVIGLSSPAIMIRFSPIPCKKGDVITVNIYNGTPYDWHVKLYN